MAQQITFGDQWQPAKIMPHAREIGGVLMQFAGMFTISGGALFSGFVVIWIGLPIPSAYSILVGAALFGGGLFGAIISIVFSVIAYNTAVWEMDLHDAKERARLKPVETPRERVPFPPIDFVEYLFSHLTEIGEFPTVEDCCSKSGGNFFRPKVVEWFEQASRAGAIQGRVERQKSGRPALAWPKERWLQAAKDALTL